MTGIKPTCGQAQIVGPMLPNGPIHVEKFVTATGTLGNRQINITVADPSGPGDWELGTHLLVSLQGTYDDNGILNTAMWAQWIDTGLPLASLRSDVSTFSWTSGATIGASIHPPTAEDIQIGGANPPGLESNLQLTGTIVCSPPSSSTFASWFSNNTISGKLLGTTARCAITELGGARAISVSGTTDGHGFQVTIYDPSGSGSSAGGDHMEIVEQPDSTGGTAAWSTQDVSGIADFSWQSGVVLAIEAQPSASQSSSPADTPNEPLGLDAVIAC
jgi:hypothetical protein